MGELGGKYRSTFPRLFSTSISPATSAKVRLVSPRLCSKSSFPRSPEREMVAVEAEMEISVP